MKTESRLGGVANILRELKASKTGFTGLVIILVFTLLGAAAPLITYNDPIKDINLAADFALPEWVTIFPGYQDLPRNMEINFTPDRWVIEEKSDRFDIAIERTESYIAIDASRKPEAEIAGETIIYRATQKFTYSYAPPSFFIFYIRINLTIASVGEAYKLQILVKTPKDKTYIIYDTGYQPYSYSESTWVNPKIISSDFPLLKEANNISLKENAAKIILSEKGEYQLEIRALYKPAPGTQIPQPTSINLSVASITLKIPGSVYGILGTNYVGADIWSQFIWGIRQSFLVGILASTVAVALGVVFGMIIGYTGKYKREALLLLVDTIYLIPLLPILLIALIIVGRNIYAVAVIIGLFTWAGLARELGNWILSLRENQYVEVARALGASELYIMLKHVMPFTFHLILFAFIIRIPFSILLEAGLSIIGFGDPFQASWGKMLNEALAGGALISAAWWWIAPPIIGLTLLSLGFVFLGFALDEIMNPKLRQEER